MTLQVSRGSVTLSSYTQTQRSCQTHLHVQKQPQEAAQSMCTCIASSTMQMGRRGRVNRVHARSCKAADLASLTWICDAEQLYTVYTQTQRSCQTHLCV
jgi:hypothetical protein